MLELIVEHNLQSIISQIALVTQSIFILASYIYISVYVYNIYSVTGYYVEDPMFIIIIRIKNIAIIITGINNNHHAAE